MKKKYQILLIVLFTVAFSIVLNFLNIISRKAEIDSSILVFVFCIGIVSYYSSLFLVGKISKDNSFIKSKATSVLCLTYIFYLLSQFVFRITEVQFFFKLEFKYMPLISLFFSGIIAVFISRSWAMKLKKDQIKFFASFFLGVSSFYLFIIYYQFSVMYFYPDKFSIIINTISVIKSYSSPI
jgi:hypothetical protein